MEKSAKMFCRCRIEDGEIWLVAHVADEDKARKAIMAYKGVKEVLFVLTSEQYMKARGGVSGLFSHAKWNNPLARRFSVNRG